MPKIVPRNTRNLFFRAKIRAEIHFSRDCLLYTLTVREEENNAPNNFEFLQDISRYKMESQQVFPFLIVNLQLKSL
jgi:hypothetical protein